MKKANYVLVLLGVCIALFSFIVLKNNMFSIEVAIIAALFAVGTKLSDAKDEVFTLLILNAWITVFNVIGIVAHYSTTLNIYEVDLRIVVQYMIPLLVALVVKTYYTKAKSVDTPEVETIEQTE